MFLKNSANKPSYEQVLLTAWQTWRKQPTRENTTNLIKASEPVIEQVINSFFGPQYIQDALLKGKAKTVLYNAYKNYDPTKGPITAFVWTYLQRLQRIIGRQQSTLSVSERLIMDAKRLQLAEKELEEQLGRTPSTDELADYTKLSKRRIEKIRKQGQVGYTSSFEAGADPSSGGWLPGMERKLDEELANEFLKIVYDSLGNEKEKAVMELYYGLNGHERLKMTEIASKLNVSPATISKTLNKIDEKVNNTINLWQKINPQSPELEI